MIRIIGEEETINYKEWKNYRCCECGSKETYIKPNGSYLWYTCKCNKKDCTEHLCNKCYMKIQNNLPNSYNNSKKMIANSRTGNLDRYSEDGKGFIGQWIAAKTLRLKDLNIEKDNFLEHIDLSKHPIHGKPDVKTRTFNPILGYWGISHIYGKWYDIDNYPFDSLFLLLMDEYEPWRNIEKVYIIPKYRIKYISGTSFTKNSSRVDNYKKFRVDENPYNDVYHSVDIPKFFSPFDLWNGKYDIYHRG